MASQRPEYNDKIRLMVSLAPIGFMSHMEHPLLRILAENKDFINVRIHFNLNGLLWTDMLQWLATTINFYELLPHWEVFTTMGEDLCNDEADTQQLCVDVLSMISGSNEKELNKV